MPLRDRKSSRQLAMSRAASSDSAEGTGLDPVGAALAVTVGVAGAAAGSPAKRSMTFITAVSSMAFVAALMSDPEPAGADGLGTCI